MDLLVPLFSFAVSTSFPPGPNNLIMASSGAAFGLRRSLPTLIGFVIGFGFMNLTVGIGLAGMTSILPQLLRVLQFVGIAYFLYLAWRTATAEEATVSKRPSRPLMFIQAAAFQWVNPKAWIIAASAQAAYAGFGAGRSVRVGVIAATFMLIGTLSAATWLLFGRGIRTYLTTKSRRGIFGWGMAVLMVASIVPTVFSAMSR